MSYKNQTPSFTPKHSDQKTSTDKMQIRNEKLRLNLNGIRGFNDQEIVRDSPAINPKHEKEQDSGRDSARNSGRNGRNFRKISLEIDAELNNLNEADNFSLDP